MSSSPYVSVPAVGVSPEAQLGVMRALSQNVNLLVQNAGASATNAAVFAKTVDLASLSTRTASEVSAIGSSIADLNTTVAAQGATLTAQGATLTAQGAGLATAEVNISTLQGQMILADAGITQIEADMISQPIGSQNFNAGQVSLAAIGQIVAARTGRISVTLANTGTDTVWLVNSSSGVLANAYPLKPGASETYPTQAALYGIPNSGTQTVTFWELW